MASTKPKTGPASHIATREQLLKEEEMLEKAQDFTKLIRRWERGQAMCLQLAAQEDRCFEKSRKRQGAEIKEELHYANKQLMTVRRAALHRLLTFEHLQYQLELNHLGKSFYAERL
ncbi:cilia- and flagella-associated protein 141 [Rhineura floridana]|uniref:cilia- and flagella-associated protein 141 n=1 Tax=Rhineura floridana TaxID=261503 RepID=UPI002AC84EFA|nr:cilia- and flagella-associated protein 141 [Rhineura floridana]